MCKKVKFEKLKKPLLLKFLARMCKKVKLEALKKLLPDRALWGVHQSDFLFQKLFSDAIGF